MILLDTMVIAEPLRLLGNKNVVAWLDAQPAETCCVTTLSVAEILRRIDKLPRQQRVTAHGVDVPRYFQEMFRDRMLTFDDKAVKTYDELLQMARRYRVALPRLSGLNAAIAYSNGVMMAATTTEGSSAFLMAQMGVTDPYYHTP